MAFEAAYSVASSHGHRVSEDHGTGHRWDAPVALGAYMHFRVRIPELEARIGGAAAAELADCLRFSLKEKVVLGMDRVLHPGLGNGATVPPPSKDIRVYLADVVFYEPRDGKQYAHAQAFEKLGVGSFKVDCQVLVPQPHPSVAGY
mmetsp:Transcript_1097/g.4062  ORF Transcript_1097/g.4062 Transcript_1097/m.4062 type:complete len:146 (-) Transcript_1097:96-533(-)